MEINISKPYFPNIAFDVISYADNSAFYQFPESYLFLRSEDPSNLYKKIIS